MIKYACDRKEDSPYRELSGKLKRVQTARLLSLIHISEPTRH